MTRRAAGAGPGRGTAMRATALVARAVDRPPAGAPA